MKKIMRKCAMVLVFALMLTAVSPTVAVKAEEEYYTVKSGDSLWSIAKEIYGSGAAYTYILEANESIQEAERIYPGQKLVIPVFDNESEYIVKSGDTLWEIANAVYGDGSLYTKLLEANDSIQHVGKIAPGQKLIIPDLNEEGPVTEEESIAKEECVVVAELDTYVHSKLQIRILILRKVLS